MHQMVDDAEITCIVFKIGEGLQCHLNVSEVVIHNDSVFSVNLGNIQKLEM